MGEPDIPDTGLTHAWLLLAFIYPERGINCTIYGTNAVKEPSSDLIGENIRCRKTKDYLAFDG